MNNYKLKKYPSLSGRKSGIYISDGKCLYLYGNRFCEAECRLLLINSDMVSVLSEQCDGLLAYVSGEGDLTVYCKDRLLLRVKEFLLLYTIPLAKHSICGVISGGSEFPCQDLRFTDTRAVALLERLIYRRRSIPCFKDDNFLELARELEGSEINALNELFLNGKAFNTDKTENK